MQQHFQRSSRELFNPMQELMELNLKTLESLSYFNPVEYSRLNHPEELMEKNIELMVNNGHKLLDYMHELFLIGESHALQASRKIKRSTNEMVNKSQSMSQNVMDSSLKASRKMNQTIRDSSSKSSRKSTSGSNSSSPSRKTKSH